MSARTLALRGLLIGVLVSTVANGGLFVWLAGSSTAWGISPRGHEFLAFFGYMAATAGLIALGFLIPAATRAPALGVVVASFLVAAPMPFALRAGRSARMAGFEQFASRSKPLVDAIRAYEAARGEAPPTLDHLVPEFLPAVPGTGLGPSPEYRYIVGTRARERFGGNAWELCVAVPMGVLNFDELLYYPLQNYPPSFGNSARLERIGDWAYVHE